MDYVFSFWVLKAVPPPTTRGLLFGHSLDVFAPFFSHCLCGIGDRPQERRHRVHLLVPAVPALLLLQARDWPGPLPQRGVTVPVRFSLRRRSLSVTILDHLNIFQ